jgi:hypothetical protein
VSDSVAFLDDGGNAGAVGAHEFDRLDDDQLMSMFSDVDAPAVSSDGGGFMDTGDAEEGTAGARAADGFGDPKRVKRSVTFATRVNKSCSFFY